MKEVAKVQDAERIRQLEIIRRKLKEQEDMMWARKWHRRITLAGILFVLMFAGLIAIVGEADAATLSYDANTLTTQEKQHLLSVGCTSNPNDRAERFYCEVSYVLYIYDDETDQEIALYFTDEKKMRAAAGKAFVKGWDWVEWEEI